MEIIIKISWGIAATLILASGLYFTFKLKFIQFNFRRMFKSLRGNKHSNEVSIFETLTLSLAARIGVGSLAGVALAIYIGGPGSIFWLFLTALLAIPNAFAESVLGAIYRKKDHGNIYRGGPSYYIEEGLGKKKIASFYAILVILAYILGFITIQANTIVSSINEIYRVYPIVIAIIVAVLSYIVIYKDIKNITKVTNALVPIMGLLYIGVCLYILIINYQAIIPVIKLIVGDAFNLHSLTGGLIGKLIIGMQRGIFSNEAGIGTGAIAASASGNNPTEVGYAQMIGIYITTFLIVGLTAFAILSSNVLNVTGNINGIELTQRAFTYHIGSIGNLFIMIVIILFAFSTIIAGYYYGESNLKYLIKKKVKRRVFILKICTILLVLIGSLMPANILWQIVDLFVSILAIINIYALFSLRNDVIYELRYYNYTRK